MASLLTRSRLADYGVGVLLACAGAAGVLITDQYSPADREADGWGLGLAVAAGLVLCARRVSPLAVLGANTVVVTAYLLMGYPYGPVLFTFCVAVYTVAGREPLARSVPAAGIALVVLLSHLLTHPASLPGLLGLVPGTAWVVVPYAAGRTVLLNRRVAERDRAEALHRRVMDERLLVAREVHDVVGHGLAAIKMQADIALHVLERQPAHAATALAAISETSAGALAELRATLNVVRSAVPAQGLGDLEAIRGRMALAGLTVELGIRGERPDSLPATVDLAGYRIVQEALTNALRHGTGETALVRICYRPAAVDVTVTNPSPALPPRAGGLGLAGMRERATALGGTFSAGLAGESFEVRATLPCGDHA
ncbi:sensor histidine kinase [Longispora albida]|uniref:sensor histidine kinase n=1 Tax=Longispora albida TaxID=203523 RepID=UPI00036E225B|nr:histidine kinase [Longispora albida]